MKNYYKTLLDQIEKFQLLSGSISSPWKKDSEGVIKITIRPVTIQEKFCYQVSEHYKNKVLHKNIPPEECVSLVKKRLPEEYKQAVFSTHVAHFHLLVDNKREIKTIKKNVSREALLKPHNRQKKYILDEGYPISFLVALGVMNAQGKIVAKQYDKFRQINRFVEMVAEVIDFLPRDIPLNIVDFGCGKAYLTFAVHYYFTNILKRKVNMIGIDLKTDLIEFCQQLSQKLECDGLTFEKSSIESFQTTLKAHLVISLHACDTATDAALEKAIQWDSDAILCVPCCQHQLFSQILCEPLNSLLRYGLFKERFTALVTDAARAELLTAQGYDVQVVEFIDMEHTSKNILLRAVKKLNTNQQEKAKMRYKAFKHFLNIKHELDNYSV